MTELDRAWARTQVEAMADRSLSPEAERRMRALMASDPELAAEVERAAMLRQSLRALVRRPAPKGQFRRLWQIPTADRPRAAYWAPASVLATVAAVAVAIGIFRIGPGPSPDDLAREQAMQDFAIAMAYLQKSATMASNEVNEAVGIGVLDAWSIGRGTIRDSVSRGMQGEQDNDD